MKSAPPPLAPERIKMAAARAITGKGERALRALAPKIPGAAKIGGEWTFNEARLRSWIDAKEQEAGQCQNDARHHNTVSGRVTSYGGARRSAARSGDGRYEQTMSRLLQRGSKRTAGGSSPRPPMATRG
jgi:hypothetical protein